MTALLVALTLSALALAGVLVFYVLRLTRHEKDRSAARVAALAHAIEEPGPSRSVDGPGMVLGPDPWEMAAPAVTPSRAPMFGADQPGLQVRARGLMAAAGVLVLALIVAGGLVLGTGGGAPASAPAAAPLELVALSHQRDGNDLEVSGTVRNPAAGEAVSGLSAVVYALDRNGVVLGTGRAPVDYPGLAAGDESPFSITVGGASAASRYRVSFRTQAGVLSHVDRRDAVMPPVEVRR